MPVTLFSFAWAVACLLTIVLNAKPKQNDITIAERNKMDFFMS